MLEITAKQILLRTKNPPQWFDIHWTLNLYRGCNHGCIYCDSRSVCYHVEHYDEMEIKTNALELLARELSSKRKVATIGTGSMSDPYNQYEQHWKFSRRALQIISDYHFPIHINTKSPLVCRDIDILSQIQKETMASVAISFSTANDSLAAKLEPGVASPSQRLLALRNLREKGINAGILYMPVLPFISDKEEQVRMMLCAAQEAGAQFILPWFCVTLREGSRDYFYRHLSVINPSLPDKYQKAFGNQYYCNSPHTRQLDELVSEFCADNAIASRMQEVQTYEKQRVETQLEIFLEN